jgi:hypothetical protein
MKTELLTQIDITRDELLEIFSSLSQDQLNKVPFSGSWTAGQVGEHLQKACSAELLYGNTRPTERDPAAMVEPIKKIFLDFSIKMNAPDFIYPEKNYHEKQETYHVLESAWTDIRKAADMLDLTQTCVDFELPGFGALTRFELISFMVIHTQRHLHQLRNIKEKLAA